VRAVIFANGAFSSTEQARHVLRHNDVLIAADGGVHNCRTLGLWPSVVIGDLDSLSNSDQEALVAHGIQIIAYPRDKNQTDLELALIYAVQIGVEEIVLFGMIGGRLDQTIANLLLLSREEWGTIRLMAIDAPDTIYLLRDSDRIIVQGKLGDIVSLVPLSPKVTGVTTRGLRWPLERASLQFGSTLSLSNELADATAEVHVGHGKLLLIHRTNDDPKIGPRPSSLKSQSSEE
jgi:thiamine pyrophosphokinase